MYVTNRVSDVTNGVSVFNIMGPKYWIVQVCIASEGLSFNEILIFVHRFKLCISALVTVSRSLKILQHQKKTNTVQWLYKVEWFKLFPRNNIQNSDTE